jgi:hypothetical protein
MYEIKSSCAATGAVLNGGGKDGDIATEPPPIEMLHEAFDIALARSVIDIVAIFVASPGTNQTDAHFTAIDWICAGVRTTEIVGVTTGALGACAIRSLPNQ